MANNDTKFSSSQLPVKVTGMQALAGKMWKPFIAMGFMIIIVSFIIGLINSGVAADYLSATKAARDGAVGGSVLAGQKASIESIKIWLPTFKFLGLGMLLGGVTFLLATILGALRVGGGKVQEALGAEVTLLKQPMTAKLFPMVMMMGMMILVVAFIIGLITAGSASAYWDHSIATELDPAAGGSALLTSLAGISSAKLWLDPFKFVGMAMLLTGIGLALATIIRVLRWQSNRLWDLLS